MRREIEEIKKSLGAIDALDEKTGEALQALEEAMEEIDRHPAVVQVHGVIGDTATEARRLNGEDGPPDEGVISDKWRSLKEHLDEWEDHHPNVVLVVGKMAEALAVVGL